MVMLVILLLNMLSCESRLRRGGYFLARLFPVDLGDLSEVLRNICPVLLCVTYDLRVDVVAKKHAGSCGL